MVLSVTSLTMTRSSLIGLVFLSVESGLQAEIYWQQMISVSEKTTAPRQRPA